MKKYCQEYLKCVNELFDSSKKPPWEFRPNLFKSKCVRLKHSPMEQDTVEKEDDSEAMKMGKLEAVSGI